MRLNFDVDSIRNNKISLLDCQVDLILRSLEFYCYTYQYIYPRKGKTETEEENLRISLVRDTYHQILSQFVDSKNEQPIYNFNYEESITDTNDISKSRRKYYLNMQKAN